MDTKSIARSHGHVGEVIVKDVVNTLAKPVPHFMPLVTMPLQDAQVDGLCALRPQGDIRPALTIRNHS